MMTAEPQGRESAGGGNGADIHQRRTVRAFPTVECTVQVEYGDTHFPATLIDISPLGVGLHSDHAADIQPGDEIRLTMETKGTSTTRLGRAAWSILRNGGVQFGVAFDEPLTDESGLLLLDMDHVKVDPVWALRIPASLAVRRRVLPFAVLDGRLCVACADSGDTAALRAVERSVEMPVSAEPAEVESLSRAIQRVFGRSGNDRVSATVQTTEREGEATRGLYTEDAVHLCDELLHAAVLRQASDIHIEPGRDAVQVRLRVDGALERYRRLARDMHAELTSRFKILSGMDIAERRAPQDGRFTYEFQPDGQEIDIRVASLPTKHGERMTLRLLGLQIEDLTLGRLGMSDTQLTMVRHCLEHPHGLMLLTGPTGSGKTTTLYAAIRELIREKELNVVTVEDPIEYDIPGVAQVEVDAADKVSFGKALRSLLRHDPDVVMIGEMRDRDSADIAVKASLTGHLVLSTLHTNSAVSVITRLCDMGVERYLIAATLRLAVAQRLVRRLCSRCRRPALLAESDAEALGRPEAVGTHVFEPAGCQYCAGRGYVGRAGFFEMIHLERPWSEAVSDGAEESDLIDLMREKNVPTLLDDAVDKLRAGTTSVAEALAAVSAW